MRSILLSSLGGFLALGLVGCAGSGYGDGGGGGGTPIVLQGQFEKRPLTPSGFGATVTLPIRDCYYEILDAGTGDPLGNGYLDGAGQAQVYLPSGAQARAYIYASYQVPGMGGASFFMRGSVVNAPYGTDFNSTQDWYVTSSAFNVGSSGTLTVTAQASNRIAGAFNIADQALRFGLGVQALSPSLTLPNLHTYWSTSTNPVDQARTYPAVLKGSGGGVLTDGSTGRALFAAAVYGNASGAPNTETDEYDDAVLQESFAHLIFADYSYRADGSSSLSLLRRDNDNAYVSRLSSSEASIAFVDGSCDFLAAAFLNRSALLDSYVDGSGTPQVDDFDLSLPLAGSEFVRGSVATNLWAVWKGPLGGGQTGLQTLWNGLNTTQVGLDGVGDYNGSALGCYPTYLVGLRSAVSGATWTSIQGTFGASGIADPTSTYFSGATLWTNEATIPFSAAGSLAFFGPGSSRFYDSTQARAYRFTQGSAGSRTLTVSPAAGADFELDLIGSGGLVAASYASPYGGTRTLTVNLAPGDYVVRVRVNPDSANAYTAGNYGYSLNVN